MRHTQRKLKPPYYTDIANNPQYDKRMPWNNDSKESRKVLYCDRDLTEKRIELIRRMVKGYNRNQNAIEKKPIQPSLSQTEKRRRKIEDLLSRSGKNGGKISWLGLQ